MSRTDELLNKYIDGELKADELEEVQLLLQLDENVKKLKALQVVENSIRTLESDLAPAGFTSKVMTKLSASSRKVKISKNYFASAINIIFLVTIAAVIGFAFGLANWNFSTSGFDTKVNETVKSVSDNVPSLLTFFKNKSVMFFGSCLSLMVLLGAYYTMEAHKTFKKRLENFSAK